MSEGNNHFRPIANRSWLLSEQAQRAARLNATPQVRIDSVRENLETRYSTECEVESSENVVIEREFPFTNFDESLFVTNPTDPTNEIRRETRRPRPYVSRTPSNVSLRREFSLTSYESDIFDPEEIYRHLRGEMSVTRTPPEYAMSVPVDVDAEMSIPLQAAHRLEQQNMEASRMRRAPTREDADNITAILNLLREIRRDINSLNDRVTRLEISRHEIDQRETDNDVSNVAYGRTERDIRHRRSTAPSFISLKEARTMIPEFDGTSRHKLQEFLNACTYAVQNINPADEESLVQAILFTKLKGKAMQDFETREVQTYDELKQQLETCYQTKQSTTHLQIEFNSLKQRPNETAHAFGQRVDILAMKLYDSMIEGEEHSATYKGAIQQTIKKQALINFQIGLRDELKILVRSQRYTTLQEAITGASAEEKLIGPTRANNYAGRNRSETTRSRQDQSSASKCFKCGKTGHYGRDCRSSKYALPKPEKPSRVNAINKFCKNCKKTGHSRDECWHLNGRPGISKKSPEQTEKTRKVNENDQRKTRQKKRDTESASGSSDSEEDARKKQPRPAVEYRVTHINDKPYARAKPELLIVKLPVREAKRERIDMLYDSGSTISLMKLKNLKDDALVYEDKIALTGITGHKIHTLGKVYATINVAEHTVKHAFYVIKDDTPIEHDGILGIDFLRKHPVKCDFQRAELRINNAVMKLHPFSKVILKPRSETIVRATTSQNQEGIVRANEPTPGVYIGNCLVKPEKYTCPISIINTTDREVEIRTPLVTLEKMERDVVAEIHTAQAIKNRKPIAPRAERI